MFFSKRIVSIESTDKVLEIGPGATPYFRSNVFLEREYESEEILIAQSGRVGVLHTDKPIFTYDGGRFPFQDNEFDYVICSHVLEHVENADTFLGEVQRVGRKGYLEFPTLYYEFIYNIPEHNLLLLYNEGKIKWMKKEESGLRKYEFIQELFFATLNKGYFGLISDCRDYFFQGFEWFDSIESTMVDQIKELTFNKSEINMPPFEVPKVKTVIDFSNVSLKQHLKFKVKSLLCRN
jgi:SAM-dependent methyltransferase